MAVKASAQITISKVIDVYAVYRYYKLQSSTLAKPAKPTANPPSGWSDTEPAYVSGSTNTLYFVDCNVYSDKSFSFSEVSKSSSYEAAKDAWNKANNAQNSADSVKDKIDIIENTGTGGNLIKNGYGELLDNTNFSGGVFTRGDCPNGCYGYFTNGVTEMIPFNPNLIYEYEFYTRLHKGASGSNYFSIMPFDVDGMLIENRHVLNYNPNLFYLSKDLKNGDTIAYFTVLSKWYTNTTQTYQRNFLIFGYKDSTGYVYPDGTYSRKVYSYIYADNSSVDKTNNTITLKSAWSGGTIKAGTCIGQTSDGPTYCYYGQVGAIKNTEWVKKSGKIYAGDVGGVVDQYSRRLLYAKSIKVYLYNNIADYAKLSIREQRIASIDVEYYLSTSATSLTGGSWSTTAPQWVNGKYMWSRTVTVDGAGNKTYSPSQNGVCIAGAKGDTGNTGAAGKGVKSIVEQYYKSTSATSLSGGSWSTSYPGWENGKYIWTRSVITYTDDTSTTTTAVCVTGAKGDKGEKGNTGAAGKDAAIISSTEPTDKTYLWCDTSASPPLLKRWNGEEWIIVNDNAEQITQIYKEIINSITQASENILMQVGEKTYSKEAVDRILNDTNTSLEQTKESFNFEFNRFQTALDNLSNSSDSKFEDISKYIRFVDGEIHIGIVGNPIMLRQRNDRISFLENNVEVAYISNRTLYFTHAEVLKDLKIGRFSWVAMDSGYLALKLVE